MGDLKLVDSQALDEMGRIQQVVNAIRSIRGEHRISPASKLNSTVTAPERDQIILKREEAVITTLARLNTLTLQSNSQPLKHAATEAVGNMEIQVPLEGIINFAEECERLKKEIKKQQVELEKIVKKLENKNFLQGAPQDIVEKEKGREQEIKGTLGKLQKALERVKE